MIDGIVGLNASLGAKEPTGKFVTASNSTPLEGFTDALNFGRFKLKRRRHRSRVCYIVINAERDIRLFTGGIIIGHTGVSVARLIREGRV